MSNFPKQTRTTQTEEDYYKTCETLFLRHMRECHPESERFDPIAFVEWLISLKPTLKEASFRNYKASVLFGLKNFDDGSSCLEEAITILQREPQTGCLKGKSYKTSNKKEKKYPPKILDRVLDELLRDIGKYKYNPQLVCILIATIAVGLRPVEWGKTDIQQNEETGERLLIVKNAKATNGRGNGEDREINITNLPPEIHKAIEYIVEFATNSENWGLEYDRISCLHARLQKKIRPRARTSYTIYSARHQYIANLKHLGVFDDIADLVGHKGKRTATEHYGRKQAGKLKISKRLDYELSVETRPRPAMGKARKSGMEDVYKRQATRESRLFEPR
ncbi:hypothetical protein V5T82_15015 [Magnetovibrio sp. PR-2]|uniref:hypothetical protein n=1 Tax=Magnetovibrio sp. PR-2 TaxID=3120356 RepID=UPI002FCE0C83